MDVLDQVRQHHTSMLSELRTTAQYVVERLQTVTAVHSLKSRIKDGEHLVEKIIRKKKEGNDFEVDCATYENHITDLVGVRVLHLFKDDWLPINEFINATWELQEQPIAYVRDGDRETQSFAEAGCRVKTHPFGYRSIHYLIKSQPAKCVRLVELQVRTIFEEGWSEIDHKVRYPRQSDDPNLTLFLTIFNRLAGSADEMGTFTKVLATYLREQAAKAKESARQEAELRKTISQLQITKGEKESLQRQIAETKRAEPGVFLKGFLNTYTPPPDILPLLKCHVCGRNMPCTLRNLASLASTPLCEECAGAGQPVTTT